MSTEPINPATDEEVDGMEAFAKDSCQGQSMTSKWCHGYMTLILRIRQEQDTKADLLAIAEKAEQFFGDPQAFTPTTGKKFCALIQAALAKAKGADPVEWDPDFHVKETKVTP